MTQQRKTFGSYITLTHMKKDLNNKVIDPISIFGLLFAFIGPYII
jgi:hypothetical protein